MSYEVGKVPDLRSEHRPRKGSWKALVVAIIALLVFAAPAIVILIAVVGG